MDKWNPKLTCIHCLAQKDSVDSPCPKCGKRNEEYQPNPNHLPPMTPLNGKYLLGRVLGQGGFGITYLALDMHLMVPVAIKELYLKNINHRSGNHTVTYTSGNAAAFQENLDRFQTEARVLAMFNEQDKEGIVSVKDQFHENGTAYIVMEYLRGMTLKEYIKTKGPMSWADAKRIADTVGHALVKVHGFSVVHKDVAPDNIMMLPDGNVKLMDFGAATNVEQKDSREIISYKRGYAPPEQYVEKGNLGEWTDVYSLAATMYYCLTGVKPVDAMRRSAGEVLTAPSKHGAKLNAKQEEAILQALSLSPRNRFKTMEEFLHALNAGTAKPRKNFVGVIAAGVAVAGITLMLTLGGRSNEGKQPEQPETTSPAAAQNVGTTAPIETEPKYEVGDSIPVTLGTYILRNYADPNLIISVEGGYGDDGARLVLRKYEEANRSRIVVMDAVPGDGFYNLQAAHTSSFLQTDKTQKLGAEVRQFVDRMDYGTEKWIFILCGEENGNKIVVMRNAAGSVMAPKEGVLKAGTCLVTAEQNLDDDSQKWHLIWSEKGDEPPTIVYKEGDLVRDAEGVHTITSTSEEKPLWAMSSNEKLVEPELIVWQNVWDATQHFRFELVDEHWYRIFPVKQPEGSNKCLEYDDSNGRLYLREVNDTTNAQRFRILYLARGVCLIQSHNQYVLGFEVTDGKTNGRAIVAKKYSEFQDPSRVKWLFGDVK